MSKAEEFAIWMEAGTIGGFALREAASELRSLDLEVMRLRAALQFLLDSEVNGWDILPAQNFARQALGAQHA